LLSESRYTLNPKLWVKTYFDTLYRFAVVRVSNTEVAKYLVQETFLAALRNVETFKVEISEKNWLFTILDIKASKEARETKYWLRLLSKSKMVEHDYSKLLKEIEEIINILTAIVKTSQNDLKTNS